MAGRKENLKALFTNTRSRVIIVFTTILLGIAVVIGVIKFMGAGSGGQELLQMFQERLPYNPSRVH